MDFDDEERIPSKKKLTRKWCKGKVGVEHEPVWQNWREMRLIYKKECPMIFECINCKKHLDIWYPRPSWYTDAEKSIWDSGPKPEIGSTEPRKKKK
jgi:hypothetical protein